MAAATLPSRIKGPQKILKQLRTLHGQVTRLRNRNDRAIHRALTAEEEQWLARTGDRLDRSLLDLTTAIDEGDVVLPGHLDPRDQRKVRKSKR